MVYSDVINNKWHEILPKKSKYTKRDVDKVYIDLFLNGKQPNEKECIFITLCTAIYHNAECSDYINNYHSNTSKQVKAMFA
jgi:hypothetical protein